ncbi:hypothetical protein HHK36_009362 [Tetracentron sinense]|uniref:Uncharacterized protein n=1 Tax=Tetracentron sinense TaxID=13715 RepID=A0A835DKZ0_TETSI|nr:hypothetical protein HHK36_009362 [Tetracentron sinense]
MARQLLLAQPVTVTTQVGLGAATLFLCVFALFMCASHSRSWRRMRGCYSSYDDNDPVIQLNSEEGMLGGESDVSVWQKNILMGGKCQLPDFSGIIIYDSAGNLVSPAGTCATLSSQ